MDPLIQLADKRVLLGITGGIAAYKSAELARLLRSNGAQVRVVMTQAATAFVAPLTFQALSGNAVHLNLLDAVEESAMGHISLARWGDLILVAPATADFIARLRLGLADDLLSTLCLAADAPMAVAPAMNRAMWENPATQDHVRRLEARGVLILGPQAGPQACGETGLGRMMEPSTMLESVAEIFRTGALAGVSVLISAGPTREPIDPVRYISNRSSGKMGYALAQAAAKAGARVTLVTGPTSLPPPQVAELVTVETARQMYEAVLARASHQDIYIGAAAVADYEPARPAESKIKKHAAAMTIALTRTRDILGAVAALQNAPFTVGFAAETDRLDEYARWKLTEKSLDMIAANRVGLERGGFDSDDNALHIFWNGGETQLAMAPKVRIAAQLIEIISRHYHEKHSVKNPR